MPPETASASVPAEPCDDLLECLVTGEGRWWDGKVRSMTITTNHEDRTSKLETVNLDGRWFIHVAYPTTKGKCPACGISRYAPPDTEAWKRVPVDAGMLTNVLEQFADVHRPVEVLFTHLYGLAVKIERAARAKLGE